MGRSPTSGIGIAPRDADGVSMRSSDFNLDVDGIGGNDHAQLNAGGIELRFGRLRIFNAVGSQLNDLPVQLETQYFNGIGFVTNGDDSCTSLAKDTVIFTNFQRDIAACETTSSGPASPLVFSRGKASLILTKPGRGRAWIPTWAAWTSSHGSRRPKLEIPASILRRAPQATPASPGCSSSGAAAAATTRTRQRGRASARRAAARS